MLTGSITLVGKDIIHSEFGTYSGGAALLQNMSFIFVSEIAQGREDRIRSCFS
jgi:hypothetical protein